MSYSNQWQKCTMTLEVSFAQTCQLPLQQPEQSLKEEKEWLRNDVLCSCLTDDGRRDDWSGDRLDTERQLRLILSPQSPLPPSNPTSIEEECHSESGKLFGRESRRVVTYIATTQLSLLQCTLFRFLEDVQAFSLNAASIQYRSDNMVSGNRFQSAIG